MIEKKNVPEILSPAGDMESFKNAVYFGADAIYVGAAQFGMRTAAARFDDELLPQAVDYAHKNGVKLYLTCNVLPRNDEIKELPSFIKKAAEFGVDAFIVSDIGVMSLVKKYAPDTDVHISTQAGITNYASANMLYELGAKRIIPARELSLSEIAEIRAKTPSELEIECFVHGAMCVSFSGRCLLSNYLTGRDSNRGDCAQPCRWKYALMEETRPGQYFPIDDKEDGTYILNARDMCMLPYVSQLIDAGVTSFKIEGRAKSAYYAGVITNAYRCAVDGYFENPSPDYVPERWIIDEAIKVSHREYCSGFFFSDPAADAQIFYGGGYKRYCNFVGITIGHEDSLVLCEQRNKFFVGDELEVLEKGKAPYKIIVKELLDMNGEPIESTPHPKMKYKIRADAQIGEGSLLRKFE